MARDLVSYGWCFDSGARDATGKSVSANDIEAVTWCIIGSRVRSHNDLGFAHKATQWLAADLRCLRVGEDANYARAARVKMMDRDEPKTHPWERLPREGSKAYDALRTYCALGARRSIAAAIQETTQTLPSASQLTQWKRWSKAHHWVSRSLARDEWLAHTADEQVKVNLHQCYLAITTVAHEFISSKNPEKVRIGSAMLKDHYPPVARVADVSERFEDLSDVPDAALDRMREIRDAARKAKDDA